MNNKKILEKILHYGFLFFLIFLPFSVLISLFFSQFSGFFWIRFLKEIFLIFLGITTIVLYFYDRKKPYWNQVDILIGFYIFWMILVTFFSGEGIRGLVYGGRYDFEFLLTFVLVGKMIPYLTGKMGKYMRAFLWSGWAVIIIGLLVRFLFHEEILIYFGFSPLASQWGWIMNIPIYHGIPGANIRRFQGIFDGPNQAAFFLVFYFFALWHFFAKKRDWYVAMFPFFCIIVGLLFLTYSRSGAGAFAVALLFLFLASIRTVFLRYKTLVVVCLLGLIGIGSVFTGVYYEKMKTILVRPGSTGGHIERMQIGIESFTQKPLGYGMGASGPASRFLFPVTKDNEKFYIPESWYIQQLVEGGVVGLVLFLGILVGIFFQIFSRSIFITSGYVWILGMNFWLHSFEAVYISLGIFSIMALVIYGNKIGKNTIWK